MSPFRWLAGCLVVRVELLRELAEVTDRLSEAERAATVWRAAHEAQATTIWNLRSDLRLAELDLERARDTAARLLSLSEVEDRLMEGERDE